MVFMRWKPKLKKIYDLGDRRLVRRFAFWPRFIPDADITIWLEFYYVFERLKKYKDYYWDHNYRVGWKEDGVCLTMKSVRARIKGEKELEEKRRINAIKFHEMMKGK